MSEILGQVVSARDPKWANNDRSVIDVCVKFSGLSFEVNFSASKDDCEQHGRAVFARALRGDFGPIADFDAG